jgi:hypothetical protein
MYMRKSFIKSAAYLLFFTNTAGLFAQENRDAQTLFGAGSGVTKKDVGFMLAPSLGFSAIDGSTASVFNLRSGITIKDQVGFGAYFNVGLNEIRPQSETINGIYMDYWTVGGFMEYTLFSKKLVHLTLPLYMGYGEIEMDSERQNIRLGEANFLQIEPSVLMELNLTRHLRFNAGIGYRWTGPVNYRNLNQDALAGFTGNVGLKMGVFK